jgi:hypothetical protein
MGLLTVARKLGKIAASFIGCKPKDTVEPDKENAATDHDEKNASSQNDQPATHDSLEKDGSTTVDGQFIDVNAYLHGIWGSDCCHSKQVTSIAYAVIGALHSETLSISGIARGMAQARSVSLKHATKQVDRLLGNEKIDPWNLIPQWVTEVIAESKQIVVAMDWTVFESDGQSTLMLSLLF